MTFAAIENALQRHLQQHLGPSLQANADTWRLARQQSLVTRFAPSPTGYLHLGHVASALYVWCLGRALGAKILLRIEDHDDTRCRPEYEATIHDDLSWLGLDFDNQPANWRHQENSLYRQSDAHAIYQAAIAQLSQKHPIYACDCSRKQLQTAQVEAQATAELNTQQQTAPIQEPNELIYPGNCRTRQLSMEAIDHGWRLQIGSELISFTDLYLGSQNQCPAEQCGDLLLRDRHGCYTYQLAVTVDDLRHGVNLIIRGQDLTSSTARQLLLRRYLQELRSSADAPVYFFHHPLICDAQGRKLSKRFLSQAIAQRRQQGEDPAKILGEAATLCGLIPATIESLNLTMLTEQVRRIIENYTS